MARNENEGFPGRSPASRSPLRPGSALAWPARAWPAVAGLALALALPAHASVVVQLEGLPEEPRDSVLAVLELAQYADRPVSAPLARHLYSRAEGQIRRALEPFGFYEPRIEGEIERLGDTDWRARFVVDPGRPTTVRSRNVAVTGPAAEAEVREIERAIAAFPLQEGDVLSHAAYEEGKRLIDLAVRGAGFLDAQTTAQRVAVRRAQASADIDLVWDSGPRYRLGPVRFSESQFPEDFVRRYVPWDDGEDADYYSADELLTLQQRLVDANYFATVGVQPVLDERADGVVPVEVLLTPAPRNVYSVGLDFGTDYGLGGRFGYERRWVNQRGHKLNTNLEYSQRLEQYSVRYRIPRPGVELREYAFAGAYRDEESATTVSRTVRLAATEVHQNWRGFVRTLGLQYLRGDFEVGDLRGSTTMLYAEGTLGRKRADSVLFPRRGYSVDVGVRLAADAVVSETNFSQAWTTARWIRSFGENDRLLLRGQLGAMAVDSFGSLPPELRFFAGGDRSVRGFDYQEIGERDARGVVIGGEYLAVGSVEYEYYLGNWNLGNWGAAVFTDFGDAFTDRFEMNAAVGLGLRWRSPIGLVRLDLAKPIETPHGTGLRVHISIGPDL